MKGRNHAIVLTIIFFFMNDTYYRDLIDKVSFNQEQMFSNGSENESGDGFDDFSKLWEILYDFDPEITPETFFEAAELCISSYFGASQNHLPIWESIIERFKRVSSDPKRYEEYKRAFIGFSDLLTDYQPDIPFEIFSEMMHVAIRKGDVEMVNAIINAAFCEELWNADEEYPEWSVWLAVFTDKDFSEVDN